MGHGASSQGGGNPSSSSSRSSASASSKWEPAWCPKTRRWYFQNRERGVSTWERPAEFLDELPPAPPDPPAETSPLVDADGLLHEGWESAYDPAIRRHYYFNRETGITTWNRPGLSPPLPPPKDAPPGESVVGVEIDTLRRENKTLVKEALEGLRSENKRLRSDQVLLEERARASAQLEISCAAFQADAERLRAERDVSEIEARAQLRERTELHEATLDTVARLLPYEAQLRQLQSDMAPMRGELTEAQEELKQFQARNGELQSYSAELPELRRRSWHLKELEDTVMPQLQRQLGKTNAEAAQFATEVVTLRTRAAEESAAFESLQRDTARLEQQDRDLASLHDALRILRRENERLEVQNVHVMASASAAGTRPTSAHSSHLLAGTRPTSAHSIDAGITDAPRPTSADSIPARAEAPRFTQRKQQEYEGVSEENAMIMRNLIADNKRLKEQVECSKAEARYHEEQCIALYPQCNFRASQERRSSRRSSSASYSSSSRSSSEVRNLHADNEHLKEQVERSKAEAHYHEKELMALQSDVQFRSEQKEMVVKNLHADNEHLKEQVEHSKAEAHYYEKELMALQSDVQFRSEQNAIAVNNLHADTEHLKEQVEHSKAEARYHEEKYTTIQSEAARLRAEQRRVNREVGRLQAEEREFSKSISQEQSELSALRHDLRREQAAEVKVASASTELRRLEVEQKALCKNVSWEQSELSALRHQLRVEHAAEKDEFDALPTRARSKTRNVARKTEPEATANAENEELQKQLGAISDRVRQEREECIVLSTRCKQLRTEQTLAEADIAAASRLHGERSRLGDFRSEEAVLRDERLALNAEAKEQRQEFAALRLERTRLRDEEERLVMARREHADAAAKLLMQQQQASAGTNAATLAKQQPQVGASNLESAEAAASDGIGRQHLQAQTQLRQLQETIRTMSPSASVSSVTADSLARSRSNSASRRPHSHVKQLHELPQEYKPQELEALKDLGIGSAVFQESSIAEAADERSVEPSMSPNARRSNSPVETTRKITLKTSPGKETRRANSPSQYGIGDAHTPTLRGHGPQHQQPRQRPAKWRGAEMRSENISVTAEERPIRQPRAVATASPGKPGRAVGATPASASRAGRGRRAASPPVAPEQRSRQDNVEPLPRPRQWIRPSGRPLRMGGPPGSPARMLRSPEGATILEGPIRGLEHLLPGVPSPMVDMKSALEADSAPFSDGEDAGLSHRDLVAHCSRLLTGLDNPIANTTLLRRHFTGSYWRGLDIAEEELEDCGYELDPLAGGGGEGAAMYRHMASGIKVWGRVLCLGAASDAPSQDDELLFVYLSKAGLHSALAGALGGDGAPAALETLQADTAGLLLGRGIYALPFDPDELRSRKAALWMAFATQLGDEPDTATWRRWFPRVEYCVPVIVPRCLCVQAVHQATPEMRHGPGRDSRGRLLPHGSAPWIIRVAACGDKVSQNVASHRETRLRAEVRVREDSLGQDHGDTLGSVRALARHLLLATSQLQEAESLIRRVLARDTETHGEDDSLTLTTLGNLAVCLDEQGRHIEAEPFHQRALEGKRRLFGREHPSTLGAVGNLAACLHAKGDSDAAAALCLKALKELCANNLPPPQQLPFEVGLAQTLSCVDNLAAGLSGQGKPEQAEPFLRFAVAAFQRGRGPSHPETLAALANLANCLGEQGRVDEAMPLLRQAHAGLEEAIGADHARTLTVASSLASCLDDGGCHEEAEALHRRVLATWPAAVGSGGPAAEPERILELRENLADCLEAQGRTAEAATLCSPGGRRAQSATSLATRRS